jgi:hypothetical protein
MEGHRGGTSPDDEVERHASTGGKGASSEISGFWCTLASAVNRYRPLFVIRNPGLRCIL